MCSMFAPNARSTRSYPHPGVRSRRREPPAQIGDPADCGGGADRRRRRRRSPPCRLRRARRSGGAAPARARRAVRRRGRHRDRAPGRVGPPGALGPRDAQGPPAAGRGAGRARRARLRGRAGGARGDGRVHLHRGAVAAAARRPFPSLAEVLAGSRRLAVLEGFNDPENLGAVARSARALGIDGALLDPTCIDPYYRRTVRVSMGEILFLPTARATAWPGDLDAVRAAGFELWALSPDPAGTSIWDLPVPDAGGGGAGRRGPGAVAGRARRRRPAGAHPHPGRGRLAQRRPRRRRHVRRPRPPVACPCPFGDVAQLVAHHLCKVGVAGSSPVVSTPELPARSSHLGSPPTSAPDRAGASEHGGERLARSTGRARSAKRRAYGFSRDVSRPRPDMALGAVSTAAPGPHLCDPAGTAGGLDP